MRYQVTKPKGGLVDVLALAPRTWPVPDRMAKGVPVLDAGKTAVALGDEIRQERAERRAARAAR